MEDEQTAADPTEAKGPKRTTHPPIGQIEDAIAVHAKALRATFVPPSRDSSPTRLIEMANSCHAAASQYIGTLRLAIARLRRVGSIEESRTMKTLKSSTKDEVNAYLQSVNEILDDLQFTDHCSIISRSTHQSLGSIQSTQSCTSSRREELKAQLNVANATAHIQREEEELDFQTRQLERETSERIKRLALQKSHLRRVREATVIATELQTLEESEGSATSAVSTPVSKNSPCLLPRSDCTNVGTGPGTNVNHKHQSSNHPSILSRTLQPRKEDSPCRENMGGISPLRGPDNTRQIPPSPLIYDSSMFLARRELFQKSCDPFLGSGQEDRFHAWVSLLKNRIQGLPLSPLDEINVLVANTAGEANKLIKDFQVAGGLNPEVALGVIWRKLFERYGSEDKIARSLRQRLQEFPQISKTRDQATGLREFADLTCVVLASFPHIPELIVLNFGDGIRPLLNKLPEGLQQRWQRKCHKYKVNHEGQHPPFEHFSDFLSDAAIEATENALTQSSTAVSPSEPSKKFNPDEEPSKGGESRASAITCVYHSGARHKSEDCKTFQHLNVNERRELVKNRKRCFKCFGEHFSNSCPRSNRCPACSQAHHSLLHIPTDLRISGEPKAQEFPGTGTLCTVSSSGHSSRKSYSKTLLVDLTLPNSPTALRCYAIIDEQSDTTFADPVVFQFFGNNSTPQPYQISTLSGHKFTQEGRVLHGLMARGVNDTQTYALPPCLENNLIPDTRSEVATPETVQQHSQISHFADNFVQFDPRARVLLLIGRDSDHLMKTQTHGDTSPFVHQTPLGWAVVGSVLINPTSDTPEHRVLRTSVFHEHFHTGLSSIDPVLHEVGSSILPSESKSTNVFKSFPDDELSGSSREDERFLSTMRKAIHINEEGHLELPLPFKNENTVMPSNQAAVFHRTKRTLDRLKNDQDHLIQCVSAMDKSIQAKHVERVPPDEPRPREGKAWWLPIFPVTHTRKGKVRLVWDSSAVYHGTSLNANLLQGPDQNNTLLGVLLRFREGEIGFVSDVESMFHSFHLEPEHRDFLRFYWFDENNPSNGLVQYRARVHIFGNRPSPAIAIFGLRHAAGKAKNASAREFIEHRFYVDDGLGTADDPETAIHVLTEARRVLGSFNIRLHKIVSNDPSVMEAFPPSERAADITDIELNSVPLQYTLGVIWNVARDCFLVTVRPSCKPFTRRGVLSVINSIYDPTGMVSPVVLGGRLLQRDILSASTSSSSLWDDPLPEAHHERWKSWMNKLVNLDCFEIPRGVVPRGFGKVINRQLHVFADASRDAIGHVVYVRSQNKEGIVHVSFLCGNSKVAPRSAASIPRLELCAALDAATAAAGVLEELTITFNSVHYYTDSLVVLGYVRNSEKRFSRYVCRRLSAILSMSQSNQWNYVTTDTNTADIATRPMDPQSLSQSRWVSGPSFLWLDPPQTVDQASLHIENLPESEELVQSLLTVSHTNTQTGPFLVDLCSRLSSWDRLCNVIVTLQSLARKWLIAARINLSKVPHSSITPTKDEARRILIKDSQTSCYSSLYSLLKAGKSFNSNHPLANLCPVLGADGLIRVGGRLRLSDEPLYRKHPVLIPVKHPIHSAILSHFHEGTRHQGRHLTHGAIRSAGYHLEEGRKSIRGFLSKCVTCKRLRGQPLEQLMADLPSDRLESVPPFTNIGLDVFGPFVTQEGRSTRRKNGTQKTWALLLTCLVSRAVHLEVLPTMDTSSFKNALHRFFAIRGPSKTIRSDRGTNFIGALGEDGITLDFGTIQKDLEIRNCKWILNPPHASHFGGAWERKIGSIRQVINGALVQMGPRALSRDELHTVLVEASSIVNSTPLWEVSYDPNDPVPMSPSNLLNLKDDQSLDPNTEFTEADILAYGKRRWRRVQYLSDQVWTRWRSQYLLDLQTRQKWLRPKRSLQAGDLVLMKDKNAKRLNWPCARVHQVKQSSDGLVRSAVLQRTQSGSKRKTRQFFERPISEIILLLPQNTSSEEASVVTSKLGST